MVVLQLFILKIMNVLLMQMWSLHKHKNKGENWYVSKVITVLNTLKVQLRPTPVFAESVCILIAITFDSNTIKKPTASHLKDFFIINKFIFIKNVSFCIISMLKSGKCGELQNFVIDFSCTLGRMSKKVHVFGGLCTKNC